MMKHKVNQRTLEARIAKLERTLKNEANGRFSRTLMYAAEDGLISWEELANSAVLALSESTAKSICDDFELDYED